MLQQRKHAWVERKKKPKIEMASGKKGICSGKALSGYPITCCYKPPNNRQYEASKTPYADVPTTNYCSVRGASTSIRAFRKTSVFQSQFLPPILTTSGDNEFSLQPKHCSPMDIGGDITGPDKWRATTTLKDPEKDSPRSSNPKDAAPVEAAPRFELGHNKTLQLVPSCWEQKTLVFQDLEDFSKTWPRTPQTPDLYRSCLLLITSRRGPKKEPRIQSTLKATTKGTITGGRTQRCLVQKSMVHSGIPTWRSSEVFQEGMKVEDNLSSRDSAFGTDTCSDTAEVDIELGLEVCQTEMDLFTQQRIIEWIMQVNTALFSPHATEPPKYSLTEQDTSIKIVYQGD